MNKSFLVNFFINIIQSVITSSITIWYDKITCVHKSKLNSIIRACVYTYWVALQHTDYLFHTNSASVFLQPAIKFFGDRQGDQSHMGSRQSTAPSALLWSQLLMTPTCRTAHWWETETSEMRNGSFRRNGVLLLHFLRHSVIWM